MSSPGMFPCTALCISAMITELELDAQKMSVLKVGIRYVSQIHRIILVTIIIAIMQGSSSLSAYLYRVVVRVQSHAHVRVGFS